MATTSLCVLIMAAVLWQHVDDLISDLGLFAVVVVAAVVVLIANKALSGSVVIIIIVSNKAGFVRVGERDIGIGWCKGLPVDRCTPVRLIVHTVRAGFWGCPMECGCLVLILGRPTLKWGSVGGVGVGCGGGIGGSDGKVFRVTDHFPRTCL